MQQPNFDKEPLNERDRGFIRMRSIMDFGMGLLWVGMGVFLVFIEKFKTGLEARFNDPTMKAFGAVCVLYGIFRIYRGYKKNYIKER